jgi:predicted RNA binding protein YcfA (HicA-like mRNA interferase family)
MNLPKRYSGLEIAKILADLGFRERGWKGSHLIMCHKQDISKRIHVPMHKVLKIGTTVGILKRAKKLVGS